MRHEHEHAKHPRSPRDLWVNLGDGSVPADVSKEIVVADDYICWVWMWERRVRIEQSIRDDWASEIFDFDIRFICRPIPR